MLIFLNIFIILCMFLMGSLFGSFFSLATYRIPRHQDIVATRSYCPTCKHRLGFFDLIPVLSYIIRGGKCKYCGEKISIRYFLLETINGIVFVVLYLLLGYNLKLLVVCLLYAILFVLIGSYIMKTRMSDEEKEEITKIKKKKKFTRSKKSGVFVSELVIAAILFLTLVITALVTAKNYNKIASQDILKSGANIVAVKNIEMCLATDYDKLTSYDISENLNGIEYRVIVSVTSIADNDFEKQDIVKKINVTVSYTNANQQEKIELSTLKGKV